MAKPKIDHVVPTRIRFAKCDPAWLQLDLSGRELRVLLALSLHADWSARGWGRCFPRRDTLALETRLQVSHVSEAVRKLAHEHRLLTVVRLGRKNVYYVRQIGSSAPMPPSDAEPFFEHLGKLGIHLTLIGFPYTVQYNPESRKFDDYPGILYSIFTDYFHGLTPTKLDQAIRVNQKTPMAPLLSALTVTAP